MPALDALLKFNLTATACKMKITLQRKEACKIVAIYAIFNCGWVVLSNTTLNYFVEDTNILTNCSLLKGLLFVIATSFLLYFLITHFSSKIKQSTTALRESEELLRFLVKNSSDTLVVIDADFNQRYVSAGVESIFGYDLSDLESQTLETVIHPDDLQTVEDAFKEAVEHPEKAVPVQYRHIHKEKGWVFAEAIGQSFFHEPAINGLIASVRDITERKLAEKQLTESYELLENLARLVPGVIYQYRLYPDGRSALPYASPGISDIFEMSPEDVQKDATRVFSRLHPDDHKLVTEALHESARTLKTFFCEFRVVLPQQELRWLSSQAEPQRMEDGSTLWHGIILDITERKQLEGQTEKLHEQLAQSQKMESVGRLAGGVAHDFNNMLGVIMGYSEMALMTVEEDQPVHKALQGIQEAGKRSAGLTKQLLAFARKQTVSPKVLDLNVTVESTLEMLKRLIGEDIDLEWRPGNGLDSIKMDPSQIDQILVNLCVNARDAIKDTGKVTIETSNKLISEKELAFHPRFIPGDYVLFAISDNGCGMDHETLLHLFEPFFTTKKIGEGTGLGLATTYGVVKQNKGFVLVDSEIGKGTTFKIYLPCYQAKYINTIESSTVKSIEVGHETILLVEDEPMILEMTMQMLEQLGYNILPASTPGEAICLAEEHVGGIDLLMTDVVMPEMNCRDLAKNILSLYPNLNRLFMSGYTADVIAHHGVLDEGVHFIQKPFTLNGLSSKVREVFGY